MKLMALWMTLKNLEVTNPKRDWKDNGFWKSKQFVCKLSFGMHFRYRHQVDDHNNRRHAPISFETTCSTKLWDDRNFTWYLAVSTFNANLAHVHFQNGGELTPTLHFRRELAQELLENDAGE